MQVKKKENVHYYIEIDGEEKVNALYFREIISGNEVKE